MSEWIEHDGSSRPVGRDVMVIVKSRDGYVYTRFPAGFWGDGEADESNWWHDEAKPMGVDIVAYKITEPHEPSSSQAPGS